MTLGYIFGFTCTVQGVTPRSALRHLEGFLKSVFMHGYCGFNGVNPPGLQYKMYNEYWSAECWSAECRGKEMCARVTSVLDNLATSNSALL